MEMRKEIRYRLDVPALFYWESAEHHRLQGEGITRDISVLGAFIVTPTCPPVEAPIQVEVVLPSLAGIKPVIRIKGEARVIRVEHPSGDTTKNGFAVVSEDFTRWSFATSHDDSQFGLEKHGRALENCQVNQATKRFYNRRPFLPASQFGNWNDLASSRSLPQASNAEETL
jgi:hypothetical protein